MMCDHLNLIERNTTGGAIRALMMCIHAYFNIWCEARAGWSVFMKRRTAVHKISALPEATQEQLASFDDVCAICYQVSDYLIFFWTKYLCEMICKKIFFFGLKFSPLKKLKMITGLFTIFQVISYNHFSLIKFSSV